MDKRSRLGQIPSSWQKQNAREQPQEQEDHNTLGGKKPHRMTLKRQDREETKENKGSETTSAASLAFFQILPARQPPFPPPPWSKTSFSVLCLRSFVLQEGRVHIVCASHAYARTPVGAGAGCSRIFGALAGRRLRIGGHHYRASAVWCASVGSSKCDMFFSARFPFSLPSCTPCQFLLPLWFSVLFFSPSSAGPAVLSLIANMATLPPCQCSAVRRPQSAQPAHRPRK